MSAQPLVAERRRPRGYVLLIVMTVGIAASLVAMALLGTSGGTRIAATHTVDGELADAIARAGMARAEAYLEAVVASGDFDAALDPNLDANCATLPLSCGGDDCTPALGDGARVTVQGKRYTRVAYGGGAYLIRFDDDDDDGQPREPEWRSYTGNNEGAGSCFEGPLSTSSVTGNHLSGGHNPLRDRNRTLYITVIGVYPGLDAETANHRAVLKQLHVAPPPQGNLAFLVGGHMHVLGGSSQAQLCSSLSGVGVGGVLEGSGTTCTCGKTYGAPTNGINDCGGCCGTNAFVDVGLGGPLPPYEPDTRDAQWFDWSSSCTFFLSSSEDGEAEGLWFWDAQGSRGPGSCASYNGSMLDPIDFAAAADQRIGRVDSFSSCWVPLGYSPAAATAAWPDTTSLYDVCGLGELSAPGTPETDWLPSATSATVTTSCGDYFRDASLAPAPVVVHKPDWSQCRGVVTVLWDPDPGAGSAVPGCGGFCNGSTPVLKYRHAHGASAVWELLGPNSPSGTSQRAYPVGVYFHRGDYTPSGSMQPVSAVLPTSNTTSTGFPMITLVVEKTFTLNGSNQLHLGVGTAANGYPSLVTGRLLMSGSDQLALAGSLIVAPVAGLTNDLDLGGSARLRVFGGVHVDDGIDVESTSIFEWDYDFELMPGTASGAEATPPTPTLSRAFP